MLSTLIYRSRVRGAFHAQQLTALESGAHERNGATGLTGLLLFDGAHFFQLLEGPEQAVQDTYRLIQRDPRHHQVVKLLHDYAPRRRFTHWGMKLFDVRNWSRQQAATFVRNSIVDAEVPAGDRAFRLMEAFASGVWRAQFAGEAQDAAPWTLEARPSPFAEVPSGHASAGAVQFALQPIIDTAAGSISSLEALLRGPAGGSPQAFFAGTTRAQAHLLDLSAKRRAFELARDIGIGDCKLAVNLLPQSLTEVPDAVETLVESIHAYGLKPQQIIVEVTEDEAISHFGEFEQALRKLRGAGISVAIDDFGAGFAGLAMLARFQPEKLKIDRQIVTGIESDGPRQAIVKAMVGCCDALGITVVAEGVETMDEWHWLRSAGIDLFQGYLFARPMLNGVSGINWPTQRVQAGP